nr:beta-1 bungarotoxin chain B, major component - many-banded krait [Bungarus multicinctus]prf//0402253B toxin RCM B,beta1 bungaro [Bungarus multicinctus]
RQRHRDCDKPPDKGNCGPVRAFYYDTRLKTCKAFQYRGCDGDHGNFKTETLCRCECLVYP